MKTVVLANVAKTPVMKTNKNGQKFVSFSICEDKIRKENDEFKRIGRTFYNVTAYVKEAMELAMTFVKGERVELSGAYNATVRNGQPVHFLNMTGGKSIFKPKAKEITEAPVAEAPAAEAKPKKRGRKKAAEKMAA